MINSYRKEPHSAAHFLTSSRHSTQNHTEDFQAVTIKAMQVLKQKSPITVQVTPNTPHIPGPLRLLLHAEKQAACK